MTHQRAVGGARFEVHEMEAWLAGVKAEIGNAHKIGAP